LLECLHRFGEARAAGLYGLAALVEHRQAEGEAFGLPVFNKGGQAVQTGGPRFAEAVEAFEKALLGDALARHHGNLTQASQDLGMAKTTLFDKVKKYGLQ
ncbi:helix-turn-helix domain-containing protein, partial [Pseudomonas aeruginosa]|uniref:helix-turn-helix domain-containing protein n=1 Tax=Pseudomonas aeruginosa TaxID=287 RepID=UPI0026DB62F5